MIWILGLRPDVKVISQSYPTAEVVQASGSKGSRLLSLLSESRPKSNWQFWADPTS